MQGAAGAWSMTKRTPRTFHVFFRVRDLQGAAWHAECALPEIAYTKHPVWGTYGARTEHVRNTYGARTEHVGKSQQM